ncbi:MAG TPA: BTAD domain-containing putative transcriptional regulator [Acidimicrobiales bacterium]|nr:BTAD domain-containing putative transcriptional regulator [Acidimicrobiales bacterium]
MALWEEQHWEIIARPDRQYYDTVDPEGMVFPEDPQTRRMPLIGDLVRIGRRSARRSITPEIDLSGSLEDVGVSHRHAVLMRQPNGSWALVDQGSTNGTFLKPDDDPVPANHRVPLHDGDRVYLGAWTMLTIQRVDSANTRSSEVEAPSKDTRGVARSRMGLEICLLGPLRVTGAGAEVNVSAPKTRGVLSVLALRVGSAVSSGDLEWALWGDRAPPTADKALQGYIATLRRLLPAGAIETTHQGYRLLGPKEAVDTFRFERRCARGRELLDQGHPGSAVAELTRALDLWRGEPLPDLVDSPVAAAEITRLTERKAGAEEDLFEGRLRLGDHQGVVPELVAAVEAEPLRERRWAQLMVALHRCGRQIEALRAYQRLRTIFGEEYGVEPSAELMALEQAIVGDRAELRWVPPDEAGVVPKTSVAGGLPVP